MPSKPSVKELGIQCLLLSHLLRLTSLTAPQASTPPISQQGDPAKQVSPLTPTARALAAHWGLPQTSRRSSTRRPPQTRALWTSQTARHALVGQNSTSGSLTSATGSFCSSSHPPQMRLCHPAKHQALRLLPHLMLKMEQLESPVPPLPPECPLPQVGVTVLCCLRVVLDI